jgi:hypothetical protein
VADQDNHDRSLEALKKMQAQIDACAEVKRLRVDVMRHQDLLSHCIDDIDHRLLRCRKQFDEYKQTCSALVGVNERLANMGEEPLEFSPHVVSENPGDLILARVVGLKVKGRI